MGLELLTRQSPVFFQVAGPTLELSRSPTVSHLISINSGLSQMGGGVVRSKKDTAGLSLFRVRSCPLVVSWADSSYLEEGRGKEGNRWPHCKNKVGSRSTFGKMII